MLISCPILKILNFTRAEIGPLILYNFIHVWHKNPEITNINNNLLYSDFGDRKEYLLKGFNSLRTEVFLRKIHKICFPQKRLNQKNNGTIRKCSSRAFQ
jgi:hypothetical protein